MRISQLPNDICWHFIGHLQSNKCKQLLSIPNLWMVESVDSLKLSNTLNKHCADMRKNMPPLQVMVQVNTSDEESKSGTTVDEAPLVVQNIINNCPNLNFRGLMTIGNPKGLPENDFKVAI